MTAYQKRLSVSNLYPISKKSNKWVVKPSPGPHSYKKSLPLLVFLRDFLKKVDTKKEAKYALEKGLVLVDGRVRKAYRFPVGLFDVITLVPESLSYRVLLTSKGNLTLKQVEDANVKLCRINTKQKVKGGAIQIGLHDGTTLHLNESYKTKDSLLLSIPDKKILKNLRYEEESLVIVTGGKHIGTIGKIKKIEMKEGSSPNMVTIESQTGIFDTIDDYVFVIGEEKPELDGLI
ncbi:MAG: 30S ribosomal protein S4e [Candidatus Methanoliparum thermophilum]|uniref:Small ribosomal subunit protein eS4 n=1 Tax=Methanoliparum thermophilum TaxID=2491083 RepID=A0A520KUC8_METT2|nr:MAG: 30S ribosomal protein S4e [Candidatus Methanoliparum thermophilum]